MSISQLHTPVAGDIISSADYNAEIQQLITEVNAKPDADTTLQADLNADLLDGAELSEIALKDGTLQTGLNADTLDGLHAADFASAAFPSGTALVFHQASPPGGWTIKSRPSVDVTLIWGNSAGDTGGTSNGVTSWAVATGFYVNTVATHALSIAELPAHTHTLGPFSGSITTVQSGTGTNISQPGLGSDVTNSTGSGNAHGHSGSTVSRGSGYRPPGHYVIIATKD
jgi:hypothetical protein